MGRTEKTETGIKNQRMLNKEPFKSSIPIINSALSEDFGGLGKDVSGDLTTELSLILDQEVNATVISRSSGILAGVPVSMLVFSQVDPNLKLVPLVKDGSSVEPNDKVIEITGSAASIIRRSSSTSTGCGRRSRIGPGSFSSTTRTTPPAPSSTTRPAPSWSRSPRGTTSPS